MAITHVASTTATASSGTTITLTKPTGTVAGNVLVAFFYVECGSAPTITAPSGWTSMGSATGTSTLGEVFTKIAGDSEPANYSFSTNVSIVVGSGALSGYSASGSVAIGDNVFDATAKAPGVAPSVTTTRPNSLLFCAFIGVGLGSGVSGMTSRVALDNGVRDLAAFDQAIAAAGATGTRTYTGSGSSWSFSMAIEDQANKIRMMI